MKNLKLVFIVVALGIFSTGCATVGGGINTARLISNEGIELNPTQANRIASAMVDNFKKADYFPGNTTPVVDTRNIIGKAIASELRMVGFAVIGSEQPNDKSEAVGKMPLEVTVNQYGQDASGNVLIVASIRTAKKTISQLFQLQGDKVQLIGQTALGQQG